MLGSTGPGRPASLFRGSRPLTADSIQIVRQLQYNGAAAIALPLPRQSSRPVVLPPRQQPVRKEPQVQDVALRALSRIYGNIWELRHEVVTTMLYLLAVIMVERGVEDTLDRWLGEDWVGSVGCILVGAGIMLYVRRLKIDARLMSPFFGNQIL